MAWYDMITGDKEGAKEVKEMMASSKEGDVAAV